MEIDLKKHCLKKHWWIPVTFVVLIVLDQWTKWLADSQLKGNRVIPIIEGFFDFSLVYNTGAAFGFGTSWAPIYRKIVFLGISCVAVVVMGVLLVQSLRGWWVARVGLTLILSGAIGNLIDRFRFGYVVDFIHVYYQSYHWPHFNIADSSICVGIGLFAIYLMWGDTKGQSSQ